MNKTLTDPDASAAAAAPRTRGFRQLDVFTAVPLLGNPLAVVLDGSGLDEVTMQRFARWTNLSETTFLLPPTDPAADYRVRIFTPLGELPFAGHPTLGSCHAWLAAGGVPKAAQVVQECGVGLVRIRRASTAAGGTRLAFAAPPLRRSGPLGEAELEAVCRALRIGRADIVAHAWCDNGPGWIGVMLASAAQVLALAPDVAAMRGLKLGVVAPQAAGADTAFEVRAFFAGDDGRFFEDPVTGSLNAALAMWLMGAGLAPARYVASQGHALGRAGRVFAERDTDGAVWIGGDVAPCIAGEVLL